MKLRFSRACWIAAWCGWIWLGVGLHRELPRDFSQTAGDLKLSDAERPVGFIGVGDLVLTETSLPNDRSRFVVWEVANARRRSECVTPPGWRTTRVSSHHAAAFGGPPEGEGSKTTWMEVLDIQTGERRRLADAAEAVGVHPMLPWVALALKGPADVLEGRWFPRSSLQVIDFRTGKRVLDWSDSQTNANGPRILECQFDGNDGVYVFADHYFGKEPDSLHSEVLRLSLTSNETARLALGRGLLVPPLNGGRIVQWGFNGEQPQSEVFEFPSGRRVFSSEGRTPEAWCRNEWALPPRLSPDGRSLYTGKGTLWSVDEARRLWPRSPEEPLGSWSVSRSFSVIEDWGDWLDRFFGPEGFTTFAVRDLADGSLRYRVRAGVHFAVFSENGSRGVTGDGRIYVLPPTVNFSLFALCQTILALPLVAVWMVLRRRRRRGSMKLI